MNDEMIINNIIHIWKRSKLMNELGLITDHQYKSIKQWLFTSTKKAERRLK